MRETVNYEGNIFIRHINLNFKAYLRATLFIILLVQLLLLSFRNYLVYHSSIELICVIIAVTMTTIALNTDKTNRSEYLYFLGIAYGFVAVFDFLHMIVYAGIDTYPGFTKNLSIQFRMIARYIESISFLIVCTFLNRKIKLNVIFIVYLLFSLSTLSFVLYWRIFPNCFIEGIGLTFFKKASEGIFTIIVLLGMFVLSKHRRNISSKVFYLLMIACINTILSQIFLALFHDVGDLFHTIGHLFKLIAYYFIYKALVETSLKKPYELLSQSNQKLEEEIVQRKNIEDSLIKESEVLKGILESTADGILVTNNTTQKIIHMNHTFISMFDIPARFITDGTFSDLRNFCKPLLKNPDDFINNTQNAENMPVDYHDCIEMNDGRIIERLSRPLIINNEIYGRVWSHRDVTEKLKAEQDLKESEEHHRKLMELLPDAVFIHKGDEPVMANTAALKLMNCDEPRNIKNQLYFNVHPDYKQESIKRLNKLTTMETTVPFAEEKFIRHDGSIIDVEIGGTSFRHKDEMYIVSVARDITERKKAYELQQEVKRKDLLLFEVMEHDRSKTEFFSTISHELKTPLNIILSTIQLMDKQFCQHEMCIHRNKLQKYLSMSKQNSYRLLRLINNLIDITRLDAGFMKMDRKNYNIISVIEDITLSVASYIESKGIHLLFDTDIEEKILACDADKIERIILNLLSNAVKFTEANGLIQVNIHDKGENILISVKDTGIGIPTEKKRNNL